MSTTIRMPEVLANVTEAAVQKWLVAPGDAPGACLVAPLTSMATAACWAHSPMSWSPSASSRSDGSAYWMLTSPPKKVG